MKTPEEIMNGLECCKNGECENCRYIDGSGHWSCVGRLINDIFAYIQQLEDHIGDLTNMVPRWISVKEREPRRLQRALVYSPAGNRIASGVYTEVGFITQTVIGEITHWMEIPDPPKEGAE